MKVKITMKNPDCVSDAIDEAAKESVEPVTGLSDSEKEDLIETRKEEIGEAISKWVEYAEYITVEIDTEAGTAIVIPV